MTSARVTDVAVVGPPGRTLRERGGSWPSSSRACRIRASTPIRTRPERFDGEHQNGADVVAGMRWTATRTVFAARAEAS
jgi:hypothetical protein